MDSLKWRIFCGEKKCNVGEYRKSDLHFSIASSIFVGNEKENAIEMLVRLSGLVRNQFAGWKMVKKKSTWMRAASTNQYTTSHAIKSIKSTMLKNPSARCFFLSNFDLHLNDGNHRLWLSYLLYTHLWIYIHIYLDLSQLWLLPFKDSSNWSSESKIAICSIKLMAVLTHKR